MSKVIGYLDQGVFLCPDCAGTNDKMRFYVENIYPYRQTCWECGKVCVVAQSSAWPNLYPGIEDRYVSEARD